MVKSVSGSCRSKGPEHSFWFVVFSARKGNANFKTHLALSQEYCGRYSIAIERLIK